MQSYECALAGASGKHLLYMDVRSLGTGKLLATWTLGALEPAEEAREPTNPEGSGVNEDENRTGLTEKGERPSSRLPLRNAIGDPRRSIVHVTQTPWRTASPSKS